MKTCTKKDCDAKQKPQELFCFSKHSGKKDGLCDWCKKCASLESKKQYQKNIEKRRKWARDYQKTSRGQDFILKNKYGISLEQKNQMLEAQKGLCKICDKILINTYVDHCHKTKIVRGLLCQNCNAAIGHVYDDPKIAIKIAEYLGLADNIIKKD